MSKVVQKIYKTVLKVTVYSEDPAPPESAGLAELSEAIDCGSDIGEVEVVERSVITDPLILRSELLAIGNDGEFFNSFLDDGGNENEQV